MAGALDGESKCFFISAGCGSQGPEHIIDLLRAHTARLDTIRARTGSTQGLLHNLQKGTNLPSKYKISGIFSEDLILS